MGGGAAMISGSDYNLGENYNHTFDAMMTLSGCGGGDCGRALKQDKTPTFIMSGSHDCICPATRDADPYYNDIPQTTCKFLAILTNGTHCHFGEEGTLEDLSCQQVEKAGCPSNIPYVDNISEDRQHEIVVQYMTLFMEAALYDNNSQQAMDAVASQLAKDQASGVMFNSASSCKM